MVRRDLLIPKVIYTFWEPQGRMPAYLRLCLRTWERNLPDYSTVILDYSSLESFIGNDTYDLPLLKTLPLSSQKDAIMVALLKRQGGIFLDADTLIRGDISWTLDYLRASEVVMFGLQLGFMAAKPGARILSLWEEGIQGRLDELRRSAPMKDEWDYVGNSVLTDSMIQMTMGLPFCRLIDRLWRSRPSYHSASKDFWQKVLNQRRWLVKLAPYRKYLRMLKPKKFGFIAENSYFGLSRYNSFERYRKFWFEPGIDMRRAFPKNPSIVALHNSRTPDWFRDLNEGQVLSQDCLLSEVLR